jgi:hypothetical protein
MPAKAGIQFINSWFPAFAGKTKKRPNIYVWIPAKPTPE